MIKMGEDGWILMYQIKPIITIPLHKQIWTVMKDYYVIRVDTYLTIFQVGLTDVNGSLRKRYMMSLGVFSTYLSIQSFPKHKPPNKVGYRSVVSQMKSNVLNSLMYWIMYRETSSFPFQTFYLGPLPSSVQFLHSAHFLHFFLFLKRLTLSQRKSYDIAN